MNSSMKSQEMGPNSAGSTAVTETVLREILCPFVVLSGFEGTQTMNSLLSWAELCFYCASALPKPSEPLENGSGISFRSRCLRIK